MFVISTMSPTNIWGVEASQGHVALSFVEHILDFFYIIHVLGASGEAPKQAQLHNI
jgi:hypothetical protein